MNETTFAEVTREFAKPTYGKTARIRVTAKAYQLNGNKHPHFSVTAEIGTPRQIETGNVQACGCLHEESAKAWPAVKPIIALHLSNADDGEPMHAEANGYYWLAGVVGGLGEQYHGGSGNYGRTPEKCLTILAEHLRISEAEAREIADKVRAVFNSGYENEMPQPLIKYVPTIEERKRAATIAAKNLFHDFVNAQRDRWEAEAKAGLALIKELAQ
jgi:hypothetical protein